jgi:hypothetical protein
MARITTKTLWAVLLILTASTALSQTIVTTSTKCLTTTCVRAPEIDPAGAMGALTLLAGALSVVRGFRRKGK